MAYDYNNYIKEYNKKNIEVVTIKLHKTKDKDIIDLLEKSEDSKQATIKKFVRKGMEK